MRRARTFLRSLWPGLPRDVLIVQAGGLMSAFGNGLVLPFAFIYLHSVRDMSPAVSGLIIATASLMSIVSTPLYGALIDRLGARQTLSLALVLQAGGWGSYVLVHEPWQGFLAAAVAGMGNGGFWPSQSTLLAALAPAEKRTSVFAVQRIMMNLGIGLGVLAGGLIASTSDPDTFTLLFLADAATFLAFVGILRLVPEGHGGKESERPSGALRSVLRNRAFMAVIGLNVVFVTAGISQFEVWPAFMKEHAGVNERGVAAVFVCNTVFIVLFQLPIARLVEGHRRTRVLALMGLVWALSWGSIPLVSWLTEGWRAVAWFGLIGIAIGVGECLQGAVLMPLVVDLADRRVLGRYMAISALSWNVGFALGPAIGGVLLGAAPALLWIVVGAMCVAGAIAAIALERALPERVLHTPQVAEPATA
jgi:MFS family permease